MLKFILEFSGLAIEPSIAIAFLVRVLWTILLGSILQYAYIRFGNSRTNKHSLGQNFVLLMLSVMFVITLVRESVALSLGLVGALSIVRFRAAIKEPEELIFLFISIAMGLGLGANQTLYTCFILLACLIFLFTRRALMGGKSVSQGLLVTVESHKKDIDLNAFVQKISQEFSLIDFRRAEISEGKSYVAFVVPSADFKIVPKMQEILRSFDPAASLSFTDNSPLVIE